MFQFPPYLVMQYRVGKQSKKNRPYALVRSKREARELVIAVSLRRRQENEFYVVVDGPKSAEDPDHMHFVGALCHCSKDIALIEGEDHPVLMPIEMARMYEGDETVKFMTNNRNLPQPALKPEEGQEG